MKVGEDTVEDLGVEFSGAKLDRLMCQCIRK